MMSSHVHRRHFLQSSAAFAMTSVVGHVRGAAPMDRVRVGIIGVAGRGAGNLADVARSDVAEIVALCDVDESRANSARQKFSQARFYGDYRRLIEQKDIQAIVIATPDHHHVFAALAALRSGKHVYCEKPLAHTVEEVRLIMRTAAKTRSVTQMGTQIHASGNYRRVVEIIQAGVLGHVRRVHVWCERRPLGMSRPEMTGQPPKGLNYDLWLGPAPARAYPPYRLGEYGLHFDWRWWWDYGGGVLADMACHFMDLPHWALGLRQPTTVAAQGKIVHKGDNTVPDLLRVDYEYPARGTQPPVQLTWYHGVPGPDLEGKVRHKGFINGVLFEGEKGNLIANYNTHRLLPEERFQDFQRPKPTIPDSVGHHREWLNAIRDSGTTTCNFDYSGALAETVLLGNVAYRAGGGKLQYDAKTGRVDGNKDAEKFLAKEYRQGWALERS